MAGLERGRSSLMDGKQLNSENVCLFVCVKKMPITRSKRNVGAIAEEPHDGLWLQPVQGESVWQR